MLTAAEPHGRCSLAIRSPPCFACVARTATASSAEPKEGAQPSSRPPLLQFVQLFISRRSCTAVSVCCTCCARVCAHLASYCFTMLFQAPSLCLSWRLRVTALPTITLRYLARERATVLRRRS